jgi:pSer/pThr/pTyr-binding forkhead associated (FHA) protein
MDNLESGRGGPRLIIIRGPRSGEAFLLAAGVTTLGRDAGNDIVLDDSRVSRRHAQVLHDGQEFVVRDLGSSNGVLVNGVRVASQELHYGDDIQLGDTVLLFTVPASRIPSARPASGATTLTEPIAAAPRERKQWIVRTARGDSYTLARVDEELRSLIETHAVSRDDELTFVVGDEPPATWVRLGTIPEVEAEFERAQRSAGRAARAAQQKTARDTIEFEVGVYLEGDSHDRLRREIAAFLERDPAGRPRDDCALAPGLPTLVAGAAARLGPAAREEAFRLLTRLRRAAGEPPQRELRELVAECLRAQRRLIPGGLLELFAQCHGMAAGEWPQLLRLLLDDPPEEGEGPATAIADSRIRSLAWRAVGSPVMAAKVVTDADAILHDVIKHGFPTLDEVRARARQRALPAADCRAVQLFLDDLLQRLHGLELGPSLLLEELQQAEALRQRSAWGIEELHGLDRLVASVRRVLEQLTRRLWVDVPAVVEHVVEHHRERGTAIEVRCDSDRRGSIRVVAEVHAVESTIGNLVMNAVQSIGRSPRSKILIDLRLLPGRSRHNPLVEISVEDSGAPDGGRARLRGGGLGLDLVSRHLGLLQGSLEERPSALGGRAFVVRFPRLALPPEVVAAPAPPAPPPAAITAPAPARAYDELVLETRRADEDE